MAGYLCGSAFKSLHRLTARRPKISGEPELEGDGMQVDDRERRPIMRTLHCHERLGETGM